MHFTLLDPPRETGIDARFDESLMTHAARHGPVACIWQTPQGLVVPRSYTGATAFQDVCARFNRNGWPIFLRHSGGGVVPQGPGIVNLSLAYAVDTKPLDHAETAYRRLCRVLSDALRTFGVDAREQAVDGSFCDGRFNLACGPKDHPQKVAGTAQLWRRTPGNDGSPVQIVLVHALLLVAVDVAAATAQANALEQALGRTRRYLAERAVSLHSLVDIPAAGSAALVAQAIQALREALGATASGPVYCAAPPSGTAASEGCCCS